MSFWRRKATLGDHIADSLVNEANDWHYAAHPSFGLFFGGDYRNTKREWRLTVGYGMQFSYLSFNQCELTRREKRHIFRALRQRSKAEARRLRETAERRLLIRSVS